MELVKSAAPSGVVLQLKIRLLGLSLMVWRRVLVPESMSLHELGYEQDSCGNAR